MERLTKQEDFFPFAFKNGATMQYFPFCNILADIVYSFMKLC